jgi:hypothetical protein
LTCQKEKQECNVYYKANKNYITKALEEVWGIDANFRGNYKEDYCRLNNDLGTQWTSWCDKYQTTLWRQKDNCDNCSRDVMQPLPDYVRWLKTNEFHYLTKERNARVADTLDGRVKEMPGLFLPSRLLDILYKINPNPIEDMFVDIALLVWIEIGEVKRYFKEGNEQDKRMFEQDKMRDKWKKLNYTTQTHARNCKKSARKQVYHLVD